jgi:parallel beta-helix repeat protein
MIIENTISNNYDGIYMYDCTNVLLKRNTISNNNFRGLFIYNSNGNSFYHNNIMNNYVQVHRPENPSNNWDNGAGEGNYWSDYTGVDDGSNGRVAGDGIGDTFIPHPFYGQGWGYNQLDNYPLMNPWGLNDPPNGDADGPYSDYEGNTIIFNASGSSDPNGDVLQYRWDFDNDGTWDTNYSTDPIATYIWDDDYTGIVTVEVYDGELTDTANTTVTVSNVPPVADADIDHMGDEPSAFNFTGSHTDPGTLDTHIYEWDFDYNGITFDFVTAGVNVSNSWADDFNGTVALRVTDDDGGWHIDTCTVTVNNVAPTITTLELPIDPVQLNTAIELTSNFTDPGTLDTHNVTIEWGDGNTSSATITGVDGTYTATASWTYGQTGVYTITITIEDDDGGTDSKTFSYYIVVYDPNDGFVTGGGWINSPAGAYYADTNLTGTANFGFVSKYKKGQQTPTGNTEFQFQVADLNFHSDFYEWLVIAGPKAIYKGTGTINNQGNFCFMISAIDEKLTPSTTIDLFRIKIWDKANGDAIIYDNGLDAPEDSDPTTPIMGGQIVIHKK